VRRTARGEQGRLAVGFTSSAALHPFVPAALLAFRQARPGVRVELDEAGTAELVKAMLEGRLDAAFVRSPVGSIAD
jgi:DNA-binding transcriptional LysR family regulator